MTVTLKVDVQLINKSSKLHTCMLRFQDGTPNSKENAWTIKYLMYLK